MVGVQGNVFGDAVPEAYLLPGPKNVKAEVVDVSEGATVKKLQVTWNSDPVCFPKGITGLHRAASRGRSGL